MATKSKAKATRTKAGGAKAASEGKKPAPAKEVTVNVTFTRTDELVVRLAPGKTVDDLRDALEYGPTVFEPGTEIDGADGPVGAVVDAQTADEEVHDIEVPV